MLDIGWPELMVIAAITVVVVGPREIPRVLRTVNGYVRKARSLASEFHSSIEDMAREADLDDLKKQMKETGDDFSGDFEKSVDPTGDVSRSMREVKDSMNERYGDEKNRAPDNSINPPADTWSKANTASAGDADTGKTTSGKKDGGKADAGAASGSGKQAAKKAEPKSAPKKAAAKKAGARKTAAKKTAAKQGGAKKTAAKKTAAKKSDAG